MFLYKFIFYLSNLPVFCRQIPNCVCYILSNSLSIEYRERKYIHNLRFLGGSRRKKYNKERGGVRGCVGAKERKLILSLPIFEKRGHVMNGEEEKKGCEELEGKNYDFL